MNAQEITAKIEELGFSVSEFGYNDMSVPEGFEFTAEAEQRIADGLKARDEARDRWHGHVGHNESSLRNDEYQKLRDEYFNMPSEWSLKTNEVFEAAGIGPYKEVEQYGGEGQGDTWYSIKYFSEHDVYIRTNGWYSSYEGTEFENGYGEEVTPVQKTITVYEQVKKD